MKFSPLALSLAAALCATSVHARADDVTLVPAPATTGGTTTSGTTDGDDSQQATRNKRAPKVQNLGAISVTAALDQARNALSPDTGSSQYVIDSKDIQALPLGASTPLNQVVLQAPGVVQDSYGGLHVRGDHANLQYRINGVIIPESISGFGQTLDARAIQSVSLLDGALPAEYGLRTAAVVDITTKSGADLGNGGSIGVTGGSFGTFNPNVSLWGNSGNWSAYFTANYLQNDVGIENPTASRTPIHDHTNQVKGFGDITYLIDNDTRLSFMFGFANNRFEIPDNPGQTPQFGYLDVTNFNSADLNEQQDEQTRFGVLSLQGKLGGTDYQVSLGQRYSGLQYLPDDIGDLMFNGVAGAINQADRQSTLQADFSTPLSDTHILRYGIYGSYDRAATNTNSLVFPADADGAQTSTTPLGIFTSDQIVAKTWSAYVQDEWSIGQNWTVNYGLRGDEYKAFNTTQSQLSPRIGVVWQAGENTTIHAGYSRYFTPPATEMITAANIEAFTGTTNAVKDYGDNEPLAERSDYFDAGISQNIGSDWTLGLDTYYRKVNRLQDEGQFGTALIYSTFNYRLGRVAGTEFTANFNDGPWSAYFNFAWSKAMGKDVMTSQYNFDPAELAYIAANYIYLDHDQKYTSSGGISYTLGDGTKFGADYLFGSGLRRDYVSPDGSSIPNGASMPAYFQLNLDVSHDFTFDHFGKLHTQLALINALDRTYELRDGTGVGVGAPQYGPRRGLYLSLQKDF
ncbi:TonB-dependent receptor [Rhodanobacter sp. DHG33]|uniref:TonB-dependent receptor n=1 Tax=Rhodanobacter sp. DHG33 TaxID=2775921 RepID=UPI0017819CE9|nr:TonB-dependent receptor [Rhodanobacter sp. DHG33]MBD8899489.1 TonB-dependent receptor [Rhodanobacter sp. DHG33]